MRAFCSAVSLALFSLVPGLAFAESGLELTSDGCRDDDASVERTNALVAQAGAAYDARDLTQAIKLTLEAHGASQCVDFLFLLGELHEEKKSVCEARPWFERYLSERPSGTHAELARARLAALDGECSANTPSAAPAQPLLGAVESAPHPTSAPKAVPATDTHVRATHEQPYWTVPRVVAWSAIGASALTSVAAVVFGIRAADANKEYEELWGQPGWEANNARLAKKGEQAETRALWLGIAAGALAGTGAVLLIVNRDGPVQSERAELSLGIEPGGAGAQCRIRF